MSLTDAEKEIILALASGAREPQTGMERHFVRVCKGLATACSPKEKEWLTFFASSVEELNKEIGFLKSIVDPGNWTTGLDRMPRFRPGDRRGKKDV
jgi:uncharacterized protein YifE (UPF0438 family)